MKFTYLQIFKIGIVLAAGLEIGKVLPHVVAGTLSKRSRLAYRDAYRRGSASYERTRTDYTGPTVVQQETPTGD